jgi:hypothetical protein
MSKQTGKEKIALKEDRALLMRNSPEPQTQSSDYDESNLQNPKPISAIQLKGTPVLRSECTSSLIIVGQAPTLEGATYLRIMIEL